MMTPLQIVHPEVFKDFCARRDALDVAARSPSD